MDTVQQLREYFGEMTVYKDLQKTNFSALTLPSFMRDWLLKRFEDEDGKFNSEELSNFIKKNLPNKDDWKSIKDRIVNDRERVKFLAKVCCDVSIATQEITFALPDYGVSARDTIIDRYVWDECKQDLLGSQDTWGVVELGYVPPETQASRGKIDLLGFKPFRPYTIDIDYYKKSRKEFKTSEWIDILLGAIDYNPAGYQDEKHKLTMLSRLLPFLEKRLNLIELAPKGTGKSYLYGRVSRFGWLSSGGVMSRAKMFYDMQKKSEGLIANNDFVVLDEVQTLRFPEIDEMRGALKGYMENGTFTVGNYSGKSDAGVILSGNINEKIMNEFDNMFVELPEIFHESALMERFHGFIKGWDIPRLTNEMKICGWALNSEYFTTILHELRSEVGYRSIIDNVILVPPHSDERDTEAIKRIATAYLKLLFPHIQSLNDIGKDGLLTVMDFDRYCLRPAKKMRKIIKTQLGMLDTEYKGKDIPNIQVKQ
ncbi:MAG: BREX system Lon protease-like protein BrxL [Planctomycetaceae bacterium]|nr:BREX system Lon protease-like protein BrxL [Planctomycetaceae bacterium]